MDVSAEERERLLVMVQRAQSEWAETRAMADARRRDVIVAAIEAGVSVTDIARAVGMSRERIYQIRDGRR